MAATDNVSRATYALDTINGLIVAEAQDAAEGDGGDSTQDLVTLRAAQVLMTEYIAATAAEVGSDDDLEDIADDLMNQLIRNASGYGGYC